MWCIWYEDGSTFSSEDGEAWESPIFDAVVIAQKTDDWDRILYDGRPWFVYYVADGLWKLHNEASFYEVTMRRAHDGIVARSGVQIRTPEFDELLKEAKNWIGY